MHYCQTQGLQLKGETRNAELIANQNVHDLVARKGLENQISFLVFLVVEHAGS